MFNYCIHRVYKYICIEDAKSVFYYFLLLVINFDSSSFLKFLLRMIPLMYVALIKFPIIWLLKACTILY